MKCIKSINSGVITRVSDHIASNFIKDGLYVYVPKKDWKFQELKTTARILKKGQVLNSMKVNG
jgi:hypothetical protein